MTAFKRLSIFIREAPQPRFNLLVLVALAIVIFIVYLPALTAFFISDDFSYVLMLHREIGSLLSGQKWAEWFLGGIDGYIWFRPASHILVLVDYLWSRLSPFGYHLTNVVLHLLSSFVAFLLSQQLTGHRSTGAMTGLLFGVLPIHVGAVSWLAARYHVLVAIFYFASLIFFVLHLRNLEKRFYFLSLGAFGFALLSVETALTLPFVLLFYDTLFNFRDMAGAGDLIKRHIPYWIVSVGYLAIRLRTGPLGLGGLGLVPEGLWYWVDGSLLNLADPWISDMGNQTRWIVIGILILLILIYRFEREIVFGLGWIPITLSATVTMGPADRYVYVASFGLCLVLAKITTGLMSQRKVLLRILGATLMVLLIVGYGITLFSRNQVYHRAGEIAEAIPKQVKILRPTLPNPARLIFVGVPDRTPEGVLIYLTGFPGLLPTMYPDTELQTIRLGKFPIWLNQLDSTFFFQVDHRRVIERADLVRALAARQQCAARTYPALVWDFANGAQGWELVNDLSGSAVQDGVLAMRATGNDPNLVSPPLNIPSIAVGNVLITMRVRSDQPTLRGELFWTANGDSDFSPGQKLGFDVRADGEYHAYSLDIAQTGALALGDQILHLRLDPVDAPADIALKEIRVFTHCSAVKEEQCECSE